jgi:solute carrier family 25 protein 14/30
VRYSSAVDAMMKTFKSEGMRGAYKGFLPFWMRITPHTVISFIVFEELRQLAGIDPI